MQSSVNTKPISEKHIRFYDKNTSVSFLKTNDSHGELSNMASGFPIEINGVKIKSSEALYQACRYPHLPEVQRIIIEQHSPMTAKMKSKAYLEQSREDWGQVQVKIMRWCLQVKLAQNYQKFSEALLGTGDAPIVELSYKDKFWGATPNADGQLVGMNVLGRLLMELREQIKENCFDTNRIAPPEISNFLLLSKQVEAIEMVNKQMPNSLDLFVMASNMPEIKHEMSHERCENYTKFGFSSMWCKAKTWLLKIFKKI